MLWRRHRDKESQLHLCRRAERPPPPADDLAVNTDDVPHERVDPAIGEDSAQPVGNCRPISETDEILVEIWQQMGDPFGAWRAWQRNMPMPVTVARLALEE